MSSYRLVVRLFVVKNGGDASIKNLSVDLKPDTYFTVILAPQGAGFKVDFLEDTVDPKATSGTITMRNYFPGTAISVAAGNQMLASSINYGNSSAVEGLAASKMTVTIQAKLPNGTPAQSIVDLDFTASKHVTLLVIPDSYGRFRPRIVADGRNL